MYFNKITGYTETWGKTKNDDPPFSPFGPFILDIEVSTICDGLGKPCPWCYKSNGPKGENMSFNTFKIILDKMPRTLTQVAFGIGNIDANKDLFKMFDYCRKSGIVPNVTINGSRMTGELYDRLAKVCGAVACSSYHDDDVCFNAVKELTDRGMSQVNLHKMLCRESYKDCFDLLVKIKKDSRLEKLNAVVFLFMKPKGDRNKFHILDNYDDYTRLIDFAMTLGVRIGFDSCSACYFMKYIEDKLKSCPKDDIKTWTYMKDMVEPCEVGLFSSYINVQGRYFHCSFTEGEPGWEGIDVVNCQDFVKDVWNASETLRFRKLLLDSEKKYGCRRCQIFKLM